MSGQLDKDLPVLYFHGKTRNLGPAPLLNGATQKVHNPTVLMTAEMGVAHFTFRQEGALMGTGVLQGVNCVSRVHQNQGKAVHDETSRFTGGQILHFANQKKILFAHKYLRVRI